MQMKLILVTHAAGCMYEYVTIRKDHMQTVLLLRVYVYA